MIERYELISAEGPAIEYDRTVHLPPDEASEVLGMEGAEAVKFCRWANRDVHMPVRVLIPGSGPGTLPHNLLAHLENDDNPFANGALHINSFDVSPEAVSMTCHNLDKFAGRTALTRSEFIGDWNDDNLWEQLAAEPYNLVLFNPPYLADKEVSGSRQGYERTPTNTMAGGFDGMDHYRTVVPRIAEVLTDSPASEMLFRFRTPGEGQTIVLDELFNAAFAGRRDYMLRLFPSEGVTMSRPGTPWEQRRWISFGVLCVNPPLEPRLDHPFSKPGRRLDSCLGRATEILAEASESL